VIRRAVELVDQTEVLEMTKRFVEVESVNPPGLEKGAADLSARILSDIGMEVKIEEALPGRPNVIASLKGTEGKPTLMFNGHLDVVPAGDLEQWSSPPFKPRVRDGLLFGRGSCDMKGGLAAVIGAIKAILKAGTKLRGNLVVTMVVDEESGGTGTLNVVERGHTADMAVVAEPTKLQVLTAHKGVVWFEITTHGRSAHASTVRSHGTGFGVNAIYKMTAVLQAAERHLIDLEKVKHPLVGNPTVNVGTIAGGTKPNVVPDTCKIVLERRLIPGERIEAVRPELDKLFGEIARNDPSFKYSIRQILARAPAETSPDERIVGLCRGALRSVTGEDPGYAGFVATTDMGFLVNQGHVPTVILGPGDIAQAHNPNEYVAVQELITASKVYAQLIVDALG